MSDQQTTSDIARVQQRIERLRGRFGRHWREVEQLPSQTASQAWNSLGNVAKGFRSSDSTGNKRHWLVELIAAGAGWYFSQPGAVRRVGRMIYPFMKAWKHKPSSSE